MPKAAAPKTAADPAETGPTEGTPATPDATEPDAAEGTPAPTEGSALTYADPVELGEGLVRVTATDGQGNAMTVDAENKSKAQAALRAAFKALKEK